MRQRLSLIQEPCRLYQVRTHFPSFGHLKLILIEQRAFSLKYEIPALILLPTLAECSSPLLINGRTSSISTTLHNHMSYEPDSNETCIQRSHDNGNLRC